MTDAPTSAARRRRRWRLGWPPWRAPAPVVPVLRLAGVIGTGGLHMGLNAQTLMGPIERAFGVSGAVAVALIINSPGGSAVQSALIHARIRELAAEKGLPVFAFAEDVAASGGYWLALAADEIFADENSVVGSIGVIAASFGLDRLIERFGVDRRVYTAGTRKAQLDIFRPEDPDDVAKVKLLLDDIHDSFKRLVASRRAGRLKAEPEHLFNGDVWTGRRALELGLIDGIGHIRPVMRGRFGAKVRLRLIPTERAGWLRRLGLARRQPLGELLGALDERAWWARYGL